MTDEAKPDEATLTVQTKNGKLRLGLQFAILAVCGWGVAYVTLLSDRHNDERYILIADYRKDRAADDAEYRKDRAADERLREEVARGVTRRLDDQSRQLDAIGQDVKLLLRIPQK